MFSALPKLADKTPLVKTKVADTTVGLASSDLTTSAAASSSLNIIEAALLLAMMAASVEVSRWKLERKFRTWKTNSATMATMRTAPQMSRVITSIFCWIGRLRNRFMVLKLIRTG